MNSSARLLALLCLGCAPLVVAADALPAWPAPVLPAPGDVALGGPMGAALDRGVARLAQEPYTPAWLLADVSFKMDRIFTNYSGDVSGRFLELATLTAPRGQPVPATLRAVMGDVANYQRADGHFGVEIDLKQPMQKLSPPIPMLWGNARLLVGLVTAARQFNDAKLLQAARRLGDFYVASADELCSPARVAEFRATGTYGDGYACCYFPAMEGLAMLYRETRDERYLNQARRMAEFFEKFDALPTEHSHGNLCAWRGILDLYEITGHRPYLDRARAKWEAAVRGGYVWSLGGVGEHWFVFFPGDEGCTESDWLRFNLELWRHTGETRYLDMAERLLLHQYAAGQCANGGYGMRHFDGDAAGPIATRGGVEEWNFCCSFHGPLGLHWLKAFLAVGSARGIYVNFPLDFSAPVKTGGGEWRVAVRRLPESRQGGVLTEVAVTPPTETAAARTSVWLRVPGWASQVRVTDAGGAPVTAVPEPGYLRVEREFKAGEKLMVTYGYGLTVEGRAFKSIKPAPGQVSRLNDVSVLAGPDVLFAVPAGGSGRTTLLALVDDAGRLEFPKDSRGRLATVALPGPEADAGQFVTALDTARPVALRPLPTDQTRRRVAFAHNLVVAPVNTLPAAALARFARRADDLDHGLTGPFFGENLESQPDLWIGAGGWTFATNGLQITGGDVGLLDGESYTDYRFEFDLTLPREGEGIAGWVVRARGLDDCLMFQVQSADSPYRAPQFKARPNTLRPHVRRSGQWTIADPLVLPKEIKRGETHHILTECQGGKVTVSLDGEKIYEGSDAGFRNGAVGFRAGGPGEQGLFRKIALHRL